MSRRSSRRSAFQSYTEPSDHDIDAGGPESISKPSLRKRGPKAELEKVSVSIETDEKEGGKGKGPPRKRNDKIEEVEAEVKAPTKSTKRKVTVEEGDVGGEVEKKVAKKRKSKEDKEKEAMPLAVRTVVTGLKRKMYIGAHISAAGGTSPLVLYTQLPQWLT